MRGREPGARSPDHSITGFKLVIRRSRRRRFSLLARRRYGTKGSETPWDGADGCRQADARSGGPCYACIVLEHFCCFLSQIHCLRARVNPTGVFLNVLPPARLRCRE